MKKDQEEIIENNRKRKSERDTKDANVEKKRGGAQGYLPDTASPQLRLPVNGPPANGCVSMSYQPQGYLSDTTGRQPRPSVN